MDGEESNKQDSSFDIIGLGKTAKAIPTEVYVETTRGVIDTFNKIISPITQTTDGIGRYIKQKFDNMVDVEKAVGAITLQKAVELAQNKGNILPPKHLKSFINSFEEAAKETDETLHQMWTNILSNQISESNFHPRDVSILANLSSEEAEILMQLNIVEDLGKNWSGYLGSPRDGFKHYVIKNEDQNLYKWSYSCNVILDLELAGVVAPNKGIYSEDDCVTILYLTKSGIRFLEVVSA